MKAIVNETKLFEGMSKMFTDKYAVVREILQNARRANATSIDVKYDQKTSLLVISNNGDPITDFQHLIHVCHSGWTPELKEENPFGLGFMSVIFASTAPVLVESSGLALAIDPKLLVAQQDIGEPVATSQKNVRLTMTVPKLDHYDIQQQFFHFDPSIAITYNDIVAPRAVVRYEVDLPQGKLQILGNLSNVRGFDGNIPISFQGFKTSFQGQSYANGRGFIVCLDHSKYQARLPDRNFILDFDVLEQDLKGGVRAGLTYLIEHDLPDEEIRRAATLVNKLGLGHVFEEMDVLPREVCFTPLTLKDLVFMDNSNNTGSICPEVTKKDIVIKVSTLTLCEETYTAFQSALQLGGSVSTLYGNTEELTQAMRGIPTTGLHPLKTSFNNSDLAVFLYYCEESAKATYLGDADQTLYINTFKTQCPYYLSDCLSGLYAYEYERGDTLIEEDVRNITYAVAEYLLSSTDNPDLNVIFTNFLRNSRVYKAPEIMRGKRFTLSIDEEGKMEIQE